MTDTRSKATRKSRSTYKSNKEIQHGTMVSKSSSSTCSDTEPFYLHPPSIRNGDLNNGHYNGQAKSTPEPMYGGILPNDGIYINPMRNGSLSPGSPSGSISGESFYLHDPQEVIYNRVKDLFDSDSNSNSSKDVKVMNNQNAFTGN